MTPIKELSEKLHQDAEGKKINKKERKKESKKLVHPVSKVDHCQFKKTGKTIFYFLTQSSTLKLNRIARLHTPLFSS